MKRIGCVLLGVTVASQALGNGVSAAEAPTFSYYSVTGNTAREIYRQMEANGPQDEEGRRRHGTAEWRVEWSFGLDRSGTTCTLTEVDVSLRGTITLPQWTPGPKAARSLSDTWARYIEVLRRHEDNHYDHGRRAAAEIRIMADALPPGECAALGRSFNNKAIRIIEKYKQMDRLYDERTQHGVKEGALL